ncbi:MAG: DUF3192 domain-containing protein [Sulfurifustis sp.]
MKKPLLRAIVPTIWLVAFCLGGCAKFYLDTADLLRQSNAENLKLLSPGMEKERVMKVMGTEPSKSLFMWIDNPYRTETVTGKDGRAYEVLYYYTDLKQQDDKITDDELTPVVFQGGRLVGIGYATLQAKVQR